MLTTNPKPPDSDELMTMPELLFELRASAATFQRSIKPYLEVIKIGGRIVVRRSALDAYLAARTRRAAEMPPKPRIGRPPKNAAA